MTFSSRWRRSASRSFSASVWAWAAFQRSSLSASSAAPFSASPDAGGAAQFAPRLSSLRSSSSSSLSSSLSSSPRAKKDLPPPAEGLLLTGVSSSCGGGEGSGGGGADLAFLGFLCFLGFFGLTFYDITFNRFRKSQKGRRQAAKS